MGENRPRFVDGAKGHVESWFWRANHPTERRAVWLKATVLRSLNGPQLAEAWCLLFDAERAWGGKLSTPLEQAHFQDAPFAAVVGECSFQETEAGVSLQGVVQTDSGPVSWSLQATPDERPLGQSLCLFPSRKMLEGRFPRNKSITPFAVQQLDGHIEIPEARWDVSGWTGMQGHNWGPAHAESYAWGHCSFADPGKAPSVVVEAVSARIKLGGWTTPLLSTMVVRRGTEEYRFDRLVDSWRQRSEMGEFGWALRMRGKAGEALLSMDAHPSEMVCLGYANPDGQTRYCLNSKLARVRLQVNPTRSSGFTCTSEHGGALEFLRTTPDVRLGEVI